MNEAIKHLEEKIAHLEHHVTAQDKVMLELADDLARMRRELKRLAARVEGTASAEPEGGEFDGEKPPHY